MKSNKYSWHLGNTDTNRNISSCPTAPGTLWALVSASSKLGPGTPSLRGTYLRVQPSLESPGPHLHPAWFLPGCSCGQQCPGPASQPPPSRAGGPGQMPPSQLPQQSSASRLPWPLSCYLCLFWQAVPGRKQLTPVARGNVSFNACTSLPGCPWDHTCPTLSWLLCTCGHGEGWKTSGSSVAGTHTESPGCPWQRDGTNGVHTQ